MICTFLAASAVFTPAALATQDYETLVAAYTEQTAEYRDAESVISALLPDVSPFHAQFLAAAKRHEGTDAALPLLGWLLQNAPRNAEVYAAAVAAIDAQVTDAGGLPSDETELFKKSYGAVKHLKYNAVDDETFAKTLLDAKLLAAFARDESTRDASVRSVYKLEHLRPGMVAPDIVGADTGGVEFRLSVYRGKVVVIDFWGDW